MDHPGFAAKRWEKQCGFGQGRGVYSNPKKILTLLPVCVCSFKVLLLMKDQCILDKIVGSVTIKKQLK